VLILLLAGLVQFALIFERQIGIDNAIREAARRGATLDTDTTNMQANATWTLLQAQTLLANSQSYNALLDTIEVCYFTPTAHPMDPASKNQIDVRVTDSYRHPLFMPIVSLFLDPIDGHIDQSLQATSTTEFHVELTSSAPTPIGAGAGTKVVETASATTGSCTQ
jgi:Flp pilus assembly protein TadG